MQNNAKTEDGFSHSLDSIEFVKSNWVLSLSQNKFNAAGGGFTKRDAERNVTCSCKQRRNNTITNFMPNYSAEHEL